MKFVVTILYLCLMAGLHLEAEAQSPEEDTLALYAEEMMMSNDLAVRQQRFEQIVSTLSDLLSREGLFDYPFERLERTSIVYAADSSFRIFTGQLFIDDDHYKYYGLLQHQSDPKHPIVLHDWSELIERPTEEIMGPDNWFGAVYYGLKDFEHAGKTYYLAFGYNGYQLFENMKIAEVISFDEKGRPTFGAPVFTNGEGLDQSRLVIKYAADVSVRLNFDEDLDLVAFDHLIPMKSPYKGKEVLFVPDGSYSGYHLDPEGRWKYIDKLFHQTSDVAPRAVPVLGNDDRDLFGRRRN